MTDWKEHIPDIEGAWRSLKESRIKTFPSHVNRASALGHPCLRHLVHLRVDWDKGKPHSFELQCIFDKGRQEETYVVRELVEAGITIFGSQKPYAYEHKGGKIVGHLDGFVCKRPDAFVEDPDALPMEIKGYNPNIWVGLNSLQDFLNDKRFYIKRVPAQVMLYAFMTNKPGAVMILEDKSNGFIKVVPVEIDWDYLSGILDQAVEVDEWVRLNSEVPESYPDPIDYDDDVCGRCQFFETVCFPARDFGEGFEIREWKEVDELLATLDAYEDTKAKVKEADTRVKKLLRGRRVVTDNYRIDGSWTKHDPPQWRMKWERLGEKPDV